MFLKADPGNPTIDLNRYQSTNCTKAMLQNNLKINSNYRYRRQSRLMSLIPGVGDGEETNQYSKTPSPTLSNMKIRSKPRKEEVSITLNINILGTNLLWLFYIFILLLLSSLLNPMTRIPNASIDVLSTISLKMKTLCLSVRNLSITRIMKWPDMVISTPKFLQGSLNGIRNMNTEKIQLLDKKKV